MSQYTKVLTAKADDLSSIPVSNPWKPHDRRRELIPAVYLMTTCMLWHSHDIP